MSRLVELAVGLALAPSAALACPGCLSSPYGDRAFGWAYLLLYAAPFFIAAGIAGALAYYRRPAIPGVRDLHRGPREDGAAVSGRGIPARLEGYDLDKETT
jgi:hypothetical protein